MQFIDMGSGNGFMCNTGFGMVKIEEGFRPQVVERKSWGFTIDGGKISSINCDDKPVYSVSVEGEKEGAKKTTDVTDAIEALAVRRIARFGDGEHRNRIRASRERALGMC